MTDVRSRLRGAGERVTPPDRAFERMVDRRARKRRAQTISAATFGLILAITVVGGTMAILSGLSRDPAEPASGGTTREVGPGQDVAPIRACMEAVGYDWDEISPVWNSPEQPPKDSVFADDAFWRAWEVCRVETGLVEPFSEERIAAENRETMKYVRCMRHRGWDLPDPWPWEGPYHPGLLTPGDFDVPEDPGAADRYHSDSNDCGLPYYDENDNILPLGSEEEGQ